MNQLIALAGNPNVGKSTVFNALTGLKQHTGNWPGKTVALCEGRWQDGEAACALVDLPGAYSLRPRSAEEAVTRDFLLSGQAGGVIVVCDATSLERGLYFALLIAEATPNVTVCLNLMDEARRRGLSVRPGRLESALKLPVCPVSARQKRGLSDLMRRSMACARPRLRIPYDPDIEAAVARLIPLLEERLPAHADPRFVALRLLEADEGALSAMGLSGLCGDDTLTACREGLGGPEAIARRLTETLHARARELARDCCEEPRPLRDRADRLLTGRALGVPVMLALLALVFWITVSLANYPSQALSRLLGWMGAGLDRLLAPAPQWLSSLLVEGVWQVLSWVIAVMLPPMAMFFPLFTLLEDSGYLPRVAFNMDRCFQGCRACGKQCLTMMMGLGCNAVGCTGCRIIDSPRERLIALLTNCLTPCNGRFPLLIALCGAFFAGGSGPLTALCLTALVLLSVGMTLAMSRALSGTLLRGQASAFTLELPPYRPPRVGQVLVRSLLDRTLKVLGRAVIAAAPAGALIWVLAHVCPGGGASLLNRLTGALEPVGRALGMDGVMLAAFLLGTPASEIVLPIALMCYTGAGTLVEVPALSTLPTLLCAQGWTPRFALRVMVFTLAHWPCATTLLTIARETRSLRWTLLAALLPTILGAGLCLLLAGIA